jgi:hypothetical protein
MHIKNNKVDYVQSQKNAHQLFNQKEKEEKEFAPHHID